MSGVGLRGPHDAEIAPLDVDDVGSRDVASARLSFPARRVRAMEDALARLMLGAQDLRAVREREQAMLRAEPSHLAAELEQRVVSPLVELRGQVSDTLATGHGRISATWWPGYVASLDRTIEDARELAAEVRG